MTTTADTEGLEQLIERLEKAEGPDRELDGAICLMLGWTRQKMKGDSRPYYRKPGVTVFYQRTEPPYFTSSVDDALTLVPEGWEWEATTLYGVARIGIGLNIENGGPFYGSHEGGNVPLALCIASLRARLHANSKA